LESEAIQIFILEDPKGRNAKQNSWVMKQTLVCF
jgi:hypothetical protein